MSDKPNPKTPSLSEIRAREGASAANLLSNVGYLLDLVERMRKVLERAAQHDDGAICRSYDKEWSCTCGAEKARALVEELKR